MRDTWLIISAYIFVHPRLSVQWHVRSYDVMFKYMVANIFIQRLQNQVTQSRPSIYDSDYYKSSIHAHL